MAVKSRPKRKRQYGNKLHGMSRVTNGRQILPTINHRSVWGRRYRDLASSFVSDLAADDDALSEGQRALIRRASALCLECENLEARFAHNGGADSDDLNLFQRTANSLRRIIETLGTNRGRIPRDVTGVTLGELLRADQAADNDMEAADG
jgi:hypothetical protein